MDLTFVIYESAKAAQMVPVVAKVLGPSKAILCNRFDGKFENCNAIAILSSFEYGQPEQKIQNFMNRYVKELKTKKIAWIGISKIDLEGSSFVKSIEKGLGDCVVWADCIEPCEQENCLPEQTVAKLIAMKRRLKDSADMPQEVLKQAIEEFLRAHNTCALCTGQGSNLRVTPIEYVYFQNAIYFLSEGGEKFAHLAANPRASIAVFDAYTGFQSLGGLQMEGTVQAVALFSEEYNQIVTLKGLNATSMQKLPATLHMFKVLPKRFELLESALTKSHYSARQVLELD